MANQSAAGFAAAWGDDYYGQLGASSCCSAHPSPVRGPDGVISADGGDQLTVAARSDGTVWEWGKVRRTPGCGYTCPPTRVPGLTGVVQVAAGTLDQELALGADGTVWAWMSSHQPDARPGSRLPVRVAGLDHVVQVAAATWYCVALEADGTVWEWPSSASAAVAGAPRQEPGLARINFIAAGGNHSLALDANGAVWSWEYTTTPGAVMDRWTNPVRVRGANGSQFAGVVAVATGGMFDLAVKRDGTVWTWGSNCYGQLANGASGGNQPVDTPARVSSLTGVVSVAA